MLKSEDTFPFSTASSETDYFIEESDVDINDSQKKVENKNGKSGHRYECNFDKCEQFFMRRDALDRHIYLHTNIKKYPCSIEGCNKAFTNLSALKRHSKIHESVKCRAKQCKSEFTTEEEMSQHYKNEHEKRSFTCTICSEVFKRKHQLSYHIYKHTKEHPYKCDEENCDKKFILHGHLIRHKSCHKKHFCNICPEKPKFRTWTDYLAHQKLSHPRESTYKCNDCSRTFNLKTNLQQHQKTHMSKDDRIIFPCTFEKCPKFYFTESNLRSHIKVKHEKIIKFICEHEGCHRELSSKQKLESHQKLHMATSLQIVRKRAQKKNTKTKRKDKGTQKISTASIMAGVTLPADVQKMVLSGLNDDIIINNTDMNEINLRNDAVDSDISSEDVQTKINGKKVEIAIVGLTNLCIPSPIV